jgi:hypothetical protein
MSTHVGKCVLLRRFLQGKLKKSVPTQLIGKTQRKLTFSTNSNKHLKNDTPENITGVANRTKIQP